jgi:hypothetical protein
MASSGNEDIKPAAMKKMKQDDGTSESAATGGAAAGAYASDAAAAAAAMTAVSYNITLGTSKHSKFDSISLLVPAGADADHVLATLLQSKKQQHTWTIVPNEKIDAKMVQKIPACLAHPIGTLPKSFPENQSKEELLDLVLAGGGGLIAKTYVVLHILHNGGKYYPSTKTLIPILVDNEQQCSQVRQAAETLSGLYDDYYLNKIYKVSVWNQAKFKVGSGGLSLEDIVEYKVNKSVAFADEWVSTFVCLGAQERDRNWSYVKVDRFLHVAIGRSLEEMERADSEKD